MVSDLNYTTPKELRAQYGLTDKEFRDLVTKGKLMYMTRYSKPLVTMDSVAETFYGDNPKIVCKRWGNIFDDVVVKYGKMKKKLSRFPKCFFKATDIPSGFYRLFYEGKCLKVCLFAMEGYARCICFSRDFESDLEFIFDSYEQGNLECHE